MKRDSYIGVIKKYKNLIKDHSIILKFKDDTTYWYLWGKIEGIFKTKKELTNFLERYYDETEEIECEI